MQVRAADLGWPGRRRRVLGPGDFWRIGAGEQRGGIPTVAIYSDADSASRHVLLSDEAVRVGPTPPSQSYLNAEAILDAARATGATAIHPGYGFLSENHAFAGACRERGIAFVGPPAEAIRLMGDKAESKKLMRAAGVPVVPGYEGNEQSADGLEEAAAKIGFPLLVKAVMGGGGKGMKLVSHQSEFKDALTSAQREAREAFGDERVILERFITSPRHIEVQVFCDAHGNAVHLFERDCSIQRRHQKVLEEAPATNISEKVRATLGQTAVQAAQAVGYVNAGTVEFIMDKATQEFYFMEMNTRLQVEHPVTEWLCGIDLVEWQLRAAAGESLPASQEDIQAKGHMIEARLYAEVPHQEFLPGTGRVLRWRLPPDAIQYAIPSGPSGVRVDSGIQEGDEVGVNYDPLIAKVIAGGETRPDACSTLCKALEELQVCGLPTNLAFLQRALGHREFADGNLDTGFIDRHKEELLAPRRHPPKMLALAAVARHKLASALNSLSSPALHPWDTPDYRRLNHIEEQAFGFKVPGGGEETVRIKFVSENVYEARVDPPSGSPLVVTEASLDSDGRFTAKVGSVPVAADVFSFTKSRKEVMHVWSEIGNADLEWDRPGHRAEAGGVSEVGTGQILAPMPGKIVKVPVEAGQKVEAGQALVVLEAMKMNHTMHAPAPGVVGPVLVRPGRQVEEGQVLLSILAANEGSEEEGARDEAA
eukprot:evm.model.scf_443EXC.3 EVM.evm.TU.scf_443EXC.3   scf_443EXC:46577-57770(+)